MRHVAFSLTAMLLLGCHASTPRPPAHRVTPRTTHSIETFFIAADIVRARQAGAADAIIVGAGAGAAGDTLGGRVRLPDGGCSLFLAAGSSSVEDVDLFVYEDDGSVLASDESPRAAAGVVVCPPHPSRAYAFARLASGHGLFSIAQLDVPPSKADAVARAVEARGGLHPSAITDSGWPGLDEAVSARRRALGGSWHDVRRIAIPMDPRAPTRVSAPVEAGQCLDAIIVPGDEIAFVDLAVLDVDGRIVGRDLSDGRSPAIAVCSKTRADLTFEARPRAGRGLAALWISSTRDVVEMSAYGQVIQYEPTQGMPLAEARAMVDRELAKAERPGPRVVLTGNSVVGRRSSFELDLTAGCSRLELVAGTPAKGLEGWLWSASNTLLAHGSGSTSATLFACAPGQKARLDVEGVSRAGPFAVEVRDDRQASPVLSRYPLAAGRLLQRLWMAGRLRGARDAGTPSVVSLVPTSIEASESVVPIGRCMDVALALDTGAEGAELRFLDADTGEELSLERGTHAAFGSTCAAGPRPSLRLRIETRVGAGSATALLARILREAPMRPPAAAAAPPPTGSKAKAGPARAR